MRWTHSAAGLAMLGAAIAISAPAAAAVDAAAEVDAAVFASSVTLAAFQKAADAKLRAERNRIEKLRADLKAQRSNAATASAAQREAETRLAAAERDFVAQLATKDRSFAAEIAVFRNQVTDIAATPEGAEALAMFNQGDRLGAIKILKRLQAASDAARQKRADIESAAEGRRIATLELETRAHGELSTSDVIASFEAVVAKDPGVFSDWIELVMLYEDAGSMDKQLNAVFAARELAKDNHELLIVLGAFGRFRKSNGEVLEAVAVFENSLTIARSIASAEPDNAQAQRDVAVLLDEIGTVEMMAGNYDGARAPVEESLTIDRKLAAADPASVLAQRDLSAGLQKLGQIELVLGNPSAARKALDESLEIDRKLAAGDPGNTLVQRDLSECLNELGNLEKASGNLAAARMVYEESLAIKRSLAAADPDNALFQHDLANALYDFAETKALGITWSQALSAWETLEQRGMLKGLDESTLAWVRTYAEEEKAAGGQ